MVMSASLRSIEHFEPLKSKRVPISRATPWMAFSTSARSVLEPMSKLGIALSRIMTSVRQGTWDPSVPEQQRQRTHHVEHVERRPDSVVAPEGRQQQAGGKTE